MHITHFVIFLSFYIYICYIIPVHATDCDPILLSYKLCLTSSLCRTRMFIDENGDDMEVFAFLFNRLISSHILQRNIDSWLCDHNCSGLTSIDLIQQSTINYDTLDDFYRLWIVLMSRYRFCEHVNQYFDGYLKTCICKQDKSCIYVHPSDIEFHFTNYQLLFWSSLVISIILAIVFVKESRKLHTLMTNIIKIT